MPYAVHYALHYIIQCIMYYTTTLLPQYSSKNYKVYCSDKNILQLNCYSSEVIAVVLFL